MIDNVKPSARIIRLTWLPPEGETISLTNIYVSECANLPSIGDPAIAIYKDGIIKFAGRVTRVNLETRSYDVELKKSLAARREFE